MKTCFTVVLVLLLALQSYGCSEAAPGEIAPAEDLAAAARHAGRDPAPILVAVTREDCAYCLRLKQQVLRPMLLSGDYEGRVVIRELMIEPAYPLTDFAGNRVGSDALAQRYDATFTPTVLLLDSEGREIADRIVGINDVGFYQHYLDQAIDSAAAALGTTAPP